MKPLVSVIIPTYKRIEDLNRAIKSVYNQSYKNIEIIVVNDDPTLTIQNNIQLKKNLTFINHTKNKGGSAARNSGIRFARGEYLAFLDDDDQFLKFKIEKMIKKINLLDDEWSGIYSWWIRERSKKLIKSKIEGDLTLPLLLFNKNLIHGGTSSLFLRSDVVKSIDGFNTSYHRHQDWELIIRICKKGKIKVIRQPLFIKGSSEQPSLSAKKILQLKFKLLNQFSSTIESYGNKLARKIYCRQILVIGFHFLKQKDFLNCLKIFSKTFVFFHSEFFISLFQIIIYYIKKYGMV